MSFFAGFNLGGASNHSPSRVRRVLENATRFVIWGAIDARGGSGRGLLSQPGDVVSGGNGVYWIDVVLTPTVTVQLVANRERLAASINNSPVWAGPLAPLLAEAGKGTSAASRDLADFDTYLLPMRAALASALRGRV